MALSQSIVSPFSDIDDGLEVNDEEEEDSDAASNTRSYSGSLSTTQQSSVKLVGETSEGGTVGASRPSSSDTSQPSHTKKQPSPLKPVGEASEGSTVGASSPSSSGTSEPSHTNKQPSPLKPVGEASEGGTVGEPTFIKRHKREVDLSGACGIFIIIIIII